jgi:hypothetical protein
VGQAVEWERGRVTLSETRYALLNSKLGRNQRVVGLWTDYVNSNQPARHKPVVQPAVRLRCNYQIKFEKSFIIKDLAYKTLFFFLEGSFA